MAPLITGAPKLINSDLFLEKRATVPMKTHCSTFFQKQITINKFWGTCALIYIDRMPSLCYSCIYIVCSGDIPYITGRLNGRVDRAVGP